MRNILVIGLAMLTVLFLGGLVFLFSRGNEEENTISKESVNSGTSQSTQQEIPVQFQEIMVTEDGFSPLVIEIDAPGAVTYINTTEQEVVIDSEGELNFGSIIVPEGEEVSTVILNEPGSYIFSSSISEEKGEIKIL